MNYEQIETDIITRLAPLTPGVDVIRLPEIQADFKRPFTKSKITVAYKGSKYEEPHTTAQIAQFEDVMIDVTIEARKLRGANGVYPLMKAVRLLLIGFRPTDCDRMYLRESAFTDLADDLWSYSFTFVSRGMIVETDPDENDPDLEYITVQNPAGDTVIEVGEPPEGDPAPSGFNYQLEQTFLN